MHLAITKGTNKRRDGYTECGKGTEEGKQQSVI